MVSDGSMDMEEERQGAKVKEQVRRMKAGVGQRKERNDRKVKAKWDAHSRESPTNKWAVNKVLDRVFCGVTK